MGGGTFPNFFCHLLVFCFSSELGKFPLKGYWKWEVLYTILFPLFIAALCFMILQVYLTYFDDGSESVEVNVVELSVSGVVDVSEVNVVEVDVSELSVSEVVDVSEVDVSELGATEVVDVSEVVFAEMDCVDC